MSRYAQSKTGKNAAGILLGGLVFLWAICATAQTPDTPGADQPARSRVVQVEQPGATSAFEAQPSIVDNMVRRGMLKWTGKQDLKAAWLSVVSNSDVVGLKVYVGPGPLSGTRPAVVEAVIKGLLGAGLPASNIIVWDQHASFLRVPGYVALEDRYHVRLAGSADFGYDPTVAYTNNPILGSLSAGDLEFNLNGATSGRNSYVSKLVTSNMTKIISIAPILNHNLAGLCGHLYSMSLGSVDNTLRFEMSDSRLAQAVPEIYALPAIGDRVALCITDGLIAQYQGEQKSLLHYATELNQIWISNDPVALDVLAIEELDRERLLNNIESRRDNPELYQNAALLQLGVGTVERIKLEIVK